MSETLNFVLAHPNEAADRIAELEAEVAEWQQAASVEVRREFYDLATTLEAQAQGYAVARDILTARIEALENALQKIADLVDSEAGEPLDDAIAIASAALAPEQDK